MAKIRTSEFSAKNIFALWPSSIVFLSPGLFILVGWTLYFGNYTPVFCLTCFSIFANRPLYSGHQFSVWPPGLFILPTNPVSSCKKSTGFWPPGHCILARSPLDSGRQFAVFLPGGHWILAAMSLYSCQEAAGFWSPGHCFLATRKQYSGLQVTLFWPPGLCILPKRPLHSGHQVPVFWQKGHWILAPGLVFWPPWQSILCTMATRLLEFRQKGHWVLATRSLGNGC